MPFQVKRMATCPLTLLELKLILDVQNSENLLLQLTYFFFAKSAMSFLQAP